MLNPNIRAKSLRAAQIRSERMQIKKRVLVGLVAVVVLVVAGLVGLSLLRPPTPSEPRVAAPATSVVLDFSDVNEATSQWTWEDIATGGNATFAWHEFRRTTQAGTIYAYNVTLWIEVDSSKAASRFDAILVSLGPPLNRDTSPYADESACWTWNGGASERVLNRRWNTVFSVVITVSPGSFTISCAAARVFGGQQAEKIETFV